VFAVRYGGTALASPQIVKPKEDHNMASRTGPHRKQEAAPTDIDTPNLGGREASRQGKSSPEQQSQRQPAASGKPVMQSEPKPPFPPQHQPAPGIEEKLDPKPKYQASRYKPAGKLEGKVALITGGDSGIGRAVAVLYAREKADVAIVYLPQEQQDADVTRRAVEAEGRKCLLIPGDLTDAAFCREVIDRTIRDLGKIDILVSNAAHQARKKSLDEVTDEEFDLTFKTNVYAYFRLAKAAIPHMKPGSAIVVTSSETGLIGNKGLPDYSATKGAINAFTKSIAQQLIEKGIRVNAVAPGPVWTPLNPSDAGTDAKKTAEFGSKSPMGRPAQPEELAPSYVFLASDADSSYITGVVLNVMGGETTAG
jgi:NAD(P)-dependent dehydrogenase (short-subunit alcohol dehydrogenase family)